MKKLNSGGFTHYVLLIAVLFVSAIAWYGSYMLMHSNADTVANVVAVTDENGCHLSGRVYDLAKKDCTNTCRHPNADGVTFKKTTTTPVRGYCTTFVSPINQDDPGAAQKRCTDTLHRIFIKDIGCARKSDQENANESRLCPLPDFPNYVADGNVDRCIAQTIAKAPTPGGPIIPVSSGDVIAVDKLHCELYGREWKPSTSKCSDNCVTDAGPLIVGTVKGIRYCRGAIVTPSNPTRCVDKLHRVWLEEGCARRPSQKDANNAVQCQAGFPYYHANYENVLTNTPTLTDYCEVSKAVAIANEAAGTPGSPTTVPPSGGNDSSDDGSSDNPTGGGSNTGSVDYTIDQDTCKLLGRQWQPSRTSASGQDTQAGCSTQQCIVSTSKVHGTSGSGIYCSGYVEQLSQGQCAGLHRMWIETVSLCAMHPKAKNAKTLANATQCVPPFTNYVFLTQSQGSDICLKPSTVEKLKKIAKSAGKPLGYVVSLPSRGLCGLKSNAHWQDGECKTVAVSKFRVATYNVLGASHTNGPKENKPTAADYGPRIMRAAKVLKDNNIDIAGLQEFQAPQREVFVSQNRDTFSIYPTSPEYGGGSDASVNSIVWNKSTFSLIEGGTKNFLYFNGHHSRYPWVKLRNKSTGQVIVFANTHDPADVHGNAAGLRYKDAYIHLSDIRGWLSEGLPVVFTGDFNATAELRAKDRAFAGNTRTKLAYCVFSSSHLMWHAYDASRNRHTTNGCLPPNNAIKIDHVWVNTGSKVTKYVTLSDADVNFSTDHKSMVYADVVADQN